MRTTLRIGTRASLLAVTQSTWVKTQIEQAHPQTRVELVKITTKGDKILDVPLAKVFSVSTFYKAFSLEPQGDTIIKVCMGTACHIRGAGQLVEEHERQLGIGAGETTEDLKFTVKTVNCVGACAMAPVMIVGDTYRGGAKAAKMATYLAEGGDDDEN